MAREPEAAPSERLSGPWRESADEKVRSVQPATIEVVCCATCGLHAYGSFMSGPPICRCPLNTQPRVTALYRLVAVADA